MDTTTTATLTATPAGFPFTARAYRYDDHGGGGGTVFPEGPWQDEPDKVVWVDPTTGLDAMIVRNWHGVWCGYVGVPEGHRLFEKDYNDLFDWETEIGDEVDVHGGLTFASRCQPGATEGSRAVCHTARPGSPEVWWFGFDCGHYNDVSPGMLQYLKGFTPEIELPGELRAAYRTIEFVQGEVTRLAAQLKVLA